MPAKSTYNDDTEAPEPEYVDLGETEHAPGSRKKQIPNWKLPTKSELCQRALQATGRKYFADRKERSRWLQIEKAMASLDRAGQVTYPKEWVERMVIWAEKRNRAYQNASLTRSVQIVFPALLSLLENEEKRQDWIHTELARRRKQPFDWTNASEEDLDYSPASIWQTGTIEELYGDMIPDNLHLE
jgi:hypothetical protein